MRWKAWQRKRISGRAVVAAANQRRWAAADLSRPRPSARAGKGGGVPKVPLPEHNTLAAASNAVEAGAVASCRDAHHVGARQEGGRLALRQAAAGERRRCEAHENSSRHGQPQICTRMASPRARTSNSRLQAAAACRAAELAACLQLADAGLAGRHAQHRPDAGAGGRAVLAVDVAGKAAAERRCSWGGQRTDGHCVAGEAWRRG